MEPTEQLAAILPAITDLVDRVQPEDLDNPTPCDKFELLDVLDHMITLGGAFGYMFRGCLLYTSDAADDDYTV